MANAIKNKLPNEQLIYFGDTAHLPYGDKSSDAIKFYSLKIAKWLIDRGCKMIVIACNSASAAAYNELLDFYKDVSIINVVDPLVQAVAKKEYKKVGVIATKMTVRSNVYQNKLNTINRDLNVAQLATPLLIPMIEEGFHNDQISQSIISTYIGNPAFEQIDALLLACTHFPLIKREIGNFLGNDVDILDSTDVVADEVYRKLESDGLLSKELREPHEFFVSDYTESFADTTNIFYPEHIKLEEVGLW